jgi:hypothetical protein
MRTPLRDRHSRRSSDGRVALEGLHASQEADHVLDAARPTDDLLFQAGELLRSQNAFAVA